MSSFRHSSGPFATIAAALLLASLCAACGTSAGGGGGFAPGTYTGFDAIDGTTLGADTAGADTTGADSKNAGDTGVQSDGGGCVAKTCSSAGATCGTLPDGCGGTLACGSCSGGKTCGAGNVCGTAACTKKTCQEIKATCGTASDGCGATQSCGGCAANQQCSANACICQPKTCKQLGAACGKVDNGCGKTLDCGVCPTCELGCPGGFSCGGKGSCAGGDLKKLVFNVTTVPVSGVVRLNSAKPTFGKYCTPTSGTQFMRVRFVELKTGYSFSIYKKCNENPHDFTFKGVIYPGTYRISVYGSNDQYSSLPQTAATIYEKFKITKATSGIVLNVVTVPISGVVTLNGSKPLFEKYCKATSNAEHMQVRFSEVTKGYSFTISRRCDSTPRDFTFSGVVFPGTYRVQVRGNSSSYSNLPTTRQTLYEKFVISKATSGIALNVTTVPVSGVVMLNGAKPNFGKYCKTTSTSEYMRVRFVEKKKGYTFTFSRRCNSSPHDFSFAGVIYPGSYSITINGSGPNYGDLPTTRQVIYENFAITKATSGISLNMTTVPISGVVTLNGAKPLFGKYCKTTSNSEFMRVQLTELKKGYSFSFYHRCDAKPHDFSFKGVVFPGAYRVQVRGTGSNYSNLPTTPQTLYDSFLITKATSGIALNVTTVPVSGVVTLNGAKPTFGPYCKTTSSSSFMRVQFTEVKLGYSFALTSRCKDTPHDFTFNGVIYPGVYRVSVSGYGKSYSNLPTTRQILYENLTITKPLSGVLLNVTTLTVAGKVTLNGGKPTFGKYCTTTSNAELMRVRFTEVTKGYSFTASRRCDDSPQAFVFEIALFPGTYRVQVSGTGSGYSDLPTTRQTVVDRLLVQ